MKPSMYYHLCGYNLATRRRKEHQECHLDEFKYISELPTLKTANLTSFLLATSTSLRNYQRIHNYYCQDKWSQKLKFKTYISNMAHQAQLALKTKAQTKANMYHYLLLTSLSPLNGSESMRSEMVLLLSMKGKRAASTRRITEEIKRKCKQSNGEPNLFMLTST
ncbi:hypothetical protein G6F70_001676 [Rhizopus microsporus]|nr:hypothetical protein G6F70_001676 [Rhizopus microsporus]KAG1215014.1 hypothetical protein G6F69_001415 [Rhizopus microsporus]KAG1238439.1 hypothetical protein G6F67_000423 [Rhizopus microsporus]